LKPTKGPGLKKSSSNIGSNGKPSLNSAHKRGNENAKT
jgi:hypothetical protein